MLFIIAYHPVKNQYPAKCFWLSNSKFSEYLWRKISPTLLEQLCAEMFRCNRHDIYWQWHILFWEAFVHFHIIIHELKRKTKGPLGKLKKSIAGRGHYAITAWDIKSPQQWPCTWTKPMCTRLLFDKYEALILRIIIIFFFLKKKKKKENRAYLWVFKNWTVTPCFMTSWYGQNWTMLRILTVL